MTQLFNPNLFHIPAFDRVVTVSARLQRPRLVLIENLLSEDECNSIIGASQSKLAPSLTVDRERGGTEINPARTSSGTYFDRHEMPALVLLDRRIEALTGHPTDRTENFTILRYGIGERYDAHQDYFEPGTASFAENAGPGTQGQRWATLITYLNTPPLGGGTSFPDVGFVSAARRGNGVYFEYAEANAAAGALHGGNVVMGGEKWITTKWFRA